MRSWFFSLQFRLVLGFALVLALSLGSVSWYVGYAAQQEAEQFQREVEEARAARIERMVARFYSDRRGDWAGLQPALEQAGSLYDWRIRVTDQEGHLVGDSHEKSGSPLREVGRRGRLFPVLSSGQEVGSIQVSLSNTPQMAPEPSFSRLVSAVNRSLLWTGLAAGMGGVLLVSLVSRRVLAPARALGSAARSLGQGDLSQRVQDPGRDEIGQLSTTFNSMAEGLEDAERQRRSLMADVAHELRTPLSNIQGYLEAIRDGLLQPDSTTLDTLHHQVLYLTSLVEDLRLLALAEAGALTVHREPDSLAELLQAAVEAVRPKAQASGISLSLELPPQLPLVELDRTRISQVMGNLLENAILHTPEAGSVTVTAQVVGSTTARVAVSDTGEGIPPEELPLVFERFHRVDPSRSRATGGVGLGLTIAKQLVEANGGSIRAESTPGQGSRFIFDLPLARPDSTHV